MAFERTTIPGETDVLDAVDTGVLSTLNKDGSRRWLKPRPSRGRFWRRRRAVAGILIAVFTLIPYLRINDKPAILLDVVHRRFTIFGTTFLPTDTLLLALLVIGVFLTIFLMTALLGRVWCGWACPQTVYMEFLYRPIERFFDGEPGRKSPPSGVRTFAKYTIYFIVSMFLAHTFLSYFVGVEALRTWVTSSPLKHPTAFLIMAGVTGLMLFDFGFFREQVCIVACPYGRFQSVMLDRRSIIVGYDPARGEPRGKLRKVSLPVVGGAPRGDCIDCGMCVTTCPTGIDIRKGLQMECIHCAQCIDACDAVMEKIGKPQGLIRYSSQARFEGEAGRRVRPRLFVYPALLLIVASAFVTLLLRQAPADFSVLRGPGLPFNSLPDGVVTNQLKLKITNRTDNDALYTVAIAGTPGIRFAEEPGSVRVPAGSARTVLVVVELPRGAFDSGGHCTADVSLASQGFTRTISYRLLGPVSNGGKP